MKPNRIIVAGGRDFSDIALMEKRLNHLLQKRSPEDTAIISGMANGADTLGTHWAKQHGFEVMRFPADWTMYGKSAGYKRNHEMLTAATGLIAFWDGRSRGTGHMIQIAREAGIRVVVIRYQQVRCICTDFLNGNPDPVPNPDCPLHGAGFAT